MSAVAQLIALAAAIRAEAEARALALEAMADELRRGDEAWLSLEDAAAIAGVSVRVIRDEARRGHLVLGSAGIEPRVQRRQLDAWMSRGPRSRPLAKCERETDEIAASLEHAAKKRMRVRKAG